MLIPWWGGDNYDASDPDCGRFEQWKKEGLSLFTMVGRPQDADILVYPSSPTTNPTMFADFQDLTAGLKGRTVVFFNDDNDSHISKHPHTWLFRTSFYKTQQQLQEFALATWSKDWGVFEPQPWSDKPKVSFCGTFDDHGVRKAGVQALTSYPNIDTNFIVRQQFWGGWIGSGRSAEIGKNVRKDFLLNIASGGYVLCGRGGGNFSYRWAETIMSGRIPLLIDTDCVLPFDFLVDWGKVFPIIKKTDIRHIGDVLLDFHNSLGPDEFVERQKTMRALWEEWISPVGFFSNFHKHF